MREVPNAYPLRSTVSSELISMANMTDLIFTTGHDLCDDTPRQSEEMRVRLTAHLGLINIHGEDTTRVTAGKISQ